MSIPKRTGEGRARAARSGSRQSKRASEVGMPPTRFVHDRMPASLERTVRARPPPTWAEATTPAVSPARGLVPGLRNVGASTERATATAPPRAIQVITQFDPTWGTPPRIPGLAWSATRAVYELGVGADAAQGNKPLLSSVARRASDSVFMQAYRAGDQASEWRYRWVRAQPGEPQQGAPYTLLGDVELLDKRPQAAAPSGFERLQRQLNTNDAFTMAAWARRPKFDISLYEWVGVSHQRGGTQGVAYHIEPRKDLPEDRQQELWEALCTSPDVPKEHRLSPEDCQVRRWFRDAEAKMKDEQAKWSR